MVPAHSSLHARSNCRLQQSVVCRFDPQQVAEWFETDIEWSDRRLAASLNIASGDIRRLLYRTAEELRSPGFAQEAMIESIAAQLGIELSRYFRGVDSNIRTGGLPPWRMRVINDYLANDPGGATLAGLANLCGLSVRHLARSFHASHGLSLCDYIAKHRIDLAHRMLAAGSTVKEVAYATGFSAPTNFATAFRRATGCTPRQYRQQLRQNMAGHKHH
jgi:AraC family transcriptional regulator